MTPAIKAALDLHEPANIKRPQFPTPEEQASFRAANKIRSSILDDNWPVKIAAFRSLFNLARFDQPSPHVLSMPRARLHLDLLQEEYAETVNATLQENLPEIADGLIDLIYVALGYLAELGFTPQQQLELMTDVHASNLTKVGEDGQPIYADNGKVLKGPNWQPADPAGLIEGWLGQEEVSHG